MPPRQVDPKRTRKALRRLARLQAKAAPDTAAPETQPETGAPPVDFSGWETQFLSEVGDRLTRYGSAFANLSKGRAEEALSILQAEKLKELEAKAKGKSRGWRRKPPRKTPSQT